MQTSPSSLSAEELRRRVERLRMLRIELDRLQQALKILSGDEQGSDDQLSSDQRGRDARSPGGNRRAPGH